jgi:nucleotide-binding universal stress UspA family protein
MESGSTRWQIVVGIDDSDGARHALAWARDEAGLHDADLHAVHAWAPPAPISEIAAMATPVDPAVFEQAAAELLERETADLAARPGSRAIQSRVVRGYTSSVLLEQAADADLLVVGSRGRGGFAGLLLGSVSQQCVQHARHPVAVIPSSAPLLPSGEVASLDVVVGVDGSEGSWTALRWALEEAGLRGAQLAVLHAWSTPFAVPPGGIGVAPMRRKDFVEQSERLLHDMVDGTVARADHKPPVIELIPVEEPAAPALLHRARGAGLLVVGGRGRGGFAGLLLGSVSQQCLHHAPCAVVVVPHRE